MSIDLPASFYLGKRYDPATSRLLDEPLNYTARDLTTHAVIIGMTGSGKTGLGINLLEEAALDGVPALIIDPKGDLTNLLLNFPGLRPDDFLPWMERDAEGSAVAEAERTAARWKEGLAQWGIDGERMRRLREKTEFTIYTPGSEAGRAVNVLDALRRPSGNPDDDAEALRDKVQGIVSALLGLIGIEADPLRSREHILLSHLVENAWRAGKDMDLGALILAIQDPPVRKLGVFDLDTFFPAKDRFELAMALNAILAAPSFAPWLAGDPFDVDAFLRAPDGKPRHAIFYVAHLSDAERAFFIALLLQQVRAWMRVQPGSTALRALLYIDEMFGVLPPYPHNPPTKTPLLYLLKNARAFGLGLTLVTQNPIDLDYKALTNAGTWFIGKLQTQYDKARLLDGLQTVAGESGAALDRDGLNDLIGALAPRVFLYHNVHQPPPVPFQSRWAMSYLKGPLTRPQIRTLMRGDETARATVASESPPGLSAIPQLSPDIAQYYLPLPPAMPVEVPFDKLKARPGAELAVPPTPANYAGRVADGVEAPLAGPVAAPLFKPYLLGMATITFDDRRTGTRHSVNRARLLPPVDNGTPPDWAGGFDVPVARAELQTAPPAGARFAELPGGLANARKLAAAQKAFVQYLYRETRITVRQNRTLKIVEDPGANGGEFRQRCADAARVALATDEQKIKDKYSRQLDKLAARLQKEQADLSSDEKELEARKHEELWTNIESFASFFGLGRTYRPLSTASRRRRMTEQTASDLDTTRDTIAGLERQLAELRQSMDGDLLAARQRWIAAQDDIVELTLVPRKSDIAVDVFGIAWRANPPAA
ncbi:MAG: DUF87 domain-containing protein [Chloroflexi bacterium]|nr:DUF87 domain-containing protein [Chloroflexota bacterium]